MSSKFKLLDSKLIWNKSFHIFIDNKFSEATTPDDQEKQENKEKLEILGRELGLAGGFGNYPNKSEECPARGMDKAAARNVLKLLNLGCKKVNFSVRQLKLFRGTNWLFQMEMIGDDRPDCPREHRYCVEVTEGEFTLHMKIYADDIYGERLQDTIDFEIRKKGKKISH